MAKLQNKNVCFLTKLVLHNEVQSFCTTKTLHNIIPTVCIVLMQRYFKMLLSATDNTANFEFNFRKSPT